MSFQQFKDEYDLNESFQEQYFDAYSDLSVHRVMLSDTPRMFFYRQALTMNDVVRDRVVIDVGSGTGILSIWAARAGAKHVFSIEASSLSYTQALVIAENGLSNQITVLSDTVENIIASGAINFVTEHSAILKDYGVSILVSEWMGFYLLHEGMLSSVLSARDFFNEVNRLLGIKGPIEMIPERATIRVAPINLSTYYEEHYCKFWNSVEDADLRRYGKMEFEANLERSRPLIDIIPSPSLLHEGISLVEMELTSLPVDTVVSISRTIHFDFSTSSAFHRYVDTLRSQGVVVDGFTLWFDVTFRDLVLSTSPFSPPTHWKQTTILLPATAREEKLVRLTSPDETLDVEVRLVATDASSRCYTIEFELK